LHFSSALWRQDSGQTEEGNGAVEGNVRGAAAALYIIDFIQGPLVGVPRGREGGHPARATGGRPASSLGFSGQVEIKWLSAFRSTLSHGWSCPHHQRPHHQCACERKVGDPRFTFSFFLRIPPITGNGISGEISLNFGNSDRKVILNLKNEISLHSDRNFGFVDRNFGDFDRNFGFVTVK